MGRRLLPVADADLVMFTDNADPVKLLALDMKTGEIVASMPVLDDLPRLSGGD